ncbi:hypothetical protein C6P42_001067 [Pichia californica]|nr:hypothetical protein C6P42_001067 [[Candida] californica]
MSDPLQTFNNPSDTDDSFDFTSNYQIHDQPLSEPIKDIDSPQFKATSPLHVNKNVLSNTDSEIIQPHHSIEGKTISKDDFSYLSSKLSPMPGAWTVPENSNILKYKQENFNEFIHSDDDVNNNNSSNNNNQIDSGQYQRENYSDVTNSKDVQGILEHGKSISPNYSSSDFSEDDFESVNNSNSSNNNNNNNNDDDDDFSQQSMDKTFPSMASPTKSLNFQFTSKENSTLNLNVSDSDYINNTSSFLNSSVRTQDLKNMILENDAPTTLINNGASNDLDLTPIINQDGFSNLDDTPIANNDRLEVVNNDHMKLSSSAINEIFTKENEDDEQNDRIQSLTSSIYSELPNNNNNNNNNNNRIQSISSSVYSQLPSHRSVGINNGLRDFRISSFKPTLHKRLSKTLESDDNDNIQIPPRSDRTFKTTTKIINRYQSVSENEPLDFTNENTIANTREGITEKEKENESIINDEHQPKVRVSVLNQSIYQNHYDLKTGEPSNLNVVTSSFKKKITPNQLSSSSILKSSPSNLSFTSSVLTHEEEEEEEEEEEDDASALFVTAIYAFNSKSLESENDSSICLSFDQDEIAFTYNLDDSGWGEVTLLSSLKRGWVPMNYFRSTVSNDFSKAELKNMPSKEFTETRIPLRLLLKHAGTFLLNPQSKPVYISGELRGYTFDAECFNGVTDGLRKLLIDTNCISRSNSVVQSKPIVRKMRKKLLRGWADLMAKAKDYMGTIATPKIEYLQLLMFHLLQKAITFLDIWGLERDRIDEEQQFQKETSIILNDKDTKLALNSSESVDFDIEYLDKPPIASYRINEIYNQLLTYLCLIAGRIDLVEHNPKSFVVVGTVIGHINLLVNEYFYIIKLSKATLNEHESEINLSKSMVKYGKLASNVNIKNQLNLLDNQTDKLRHLVDELNTYIKIIHNTSLKTTSNNNGTLSTHPSISKSDSKKDLYFYSREGGAVVVCACKMIELASNAYRILKTIVSFTNDLILPNNRKYPNYIKMKISPNDFIKQCSNALVNDSNIQQQVKKYKKLSMTLEGQSSLANRASNRYSTFKMGNSTDVLLSSSGLDFLSQVEPGSASSTPFLNQNGFEDTNQLDNTFAYEFNIEDEIIRNEKGDKIIGASFRALIYLLTDENNPPDYFLISTFFLTFRIFSDSSQLLDELIRRFDVNNHYKDKQSTFNDTITESKMRSRRKLIVKAFQFWLESYWKTRSDYVLLAPLMNFFNEGMKSFLPIESYQLLVTASKLIGHPPIENVNDKLNYYNNISNNQQLLPRKISSKMHKKTLSRMSLGAETQGLLNEIDAYNSFLEDIETYKLEEVDGAASQDVRSSISLNLNLELKNSNSNSILLTKQQISMIRKVVISYRKMLGSHWTSKFKELEFNPLDTKSMIDSWWNTSKESWKILNEDLTLLNFNGLEIAKQLTLIESKMFCSIQAGELLNQNFTTKKLHLNLSPNIQKSILFTNLLSDYVIESILKPGLQMRQRIHAFKCWLKIAISCLYLRNFNSLASIMTSLQSFLITRITKIWEGLSEKYEELFHYLASIIHPNKNYNTYREKLRDFLATNEQDNLDIPTVPYLSLFLQDLTFVVDGNPNYRSNIKSFLDEKLINIDKYFKITEIISDIQTLQISYKDVGELGSINNDKNTDIVRSETLKNLRSQLDSNNDVSFADMFDIMGVPVLQELILLEIWKVKQTNAKDDDRSWKLSCAIQPRENEK